MCHVRPPTLQLFIKSQALLLSMFKIIGVLTSRLIDSIIFLTYSISCTQFVEAINSASVTNKVTVACILLFIPTGAPFIKTQYPLTLRLVSKSLA
jgi:hypothetical protein